jgi:hypothetical protein
MTPLVAAPTSTVSPSTAANELTPAGVFVFQSCFPVFVSKPYTRDEFYLTPVGALAAGLDPDEYR